MESESKRLRIGVLGTGKVVPISIITPLKEDIGIDLVGIASSNKDRGKLLADQYGIHQVYDSYEHLLNDSSIDAVYIALATDLHKKWIIEAAKLKKHILVEKPICLSMKDFSEIKAAIEENNIFLQEAIMMRAHPWQNFIKEILDNHTYGRLIKLQTNFTFELPETLATSYRFFPEKGGGAYYDNSPYWIQFIQYCIGLDYSTCQADSNFDGPNGIDNDFSCQLVYPNGVLANFFSSYVKPYEAIHIIELELASIRIRNFTRPTFGKQKLIIEIINKADNKTERVIFKEESYYLNQLIKFKEIIFQITLSEPLLQMGARIDTMEKIYQTAKKKYNEFVEYQKINLSNL